MVMAQTPQLRTLYLYLTEGCNCSCRHCWIVGERFGQSGKEMAVLDPALLRRALEQALPLGLTSVKWTGGEPTLHPGFAQMLSLQKELGLTGVVETNGMLVDDQLANQMKESGVSQVSVSLDSSNPAIHDSIRGVAGGFRRTVAGIRSLVAADYRPELILTLQKTNYCDLQSFLTLAVQLGAGSVKLNVLQPVLRGQSMMTGGNALSVRETLDIKAWLESNVVTELPVSIDLPLAFRPLSKILSGQESGTCQIFTILGLLARGEYALCGIGQHVPELAMGDVREVSLAEVWQCHPVLKRLRRGLPGQLQGICADCLMNGACMGACVASNYQVSGDLLAPYWFCEEAVRQGLFPASRRSSKAPLKFPVGMSGQND